MKFREWIILEDKNSSIMYHGTSMAYWDSIKKNGLEPFPSEKSWDVDPDASLNTPSRVSFGGVYLTKNIMTATSAAFRVAKKTNSTRLILVVQVDPRTLLADEDNITFSVKDIRLPGLIVNDYLASQLYISYHLVYKNPKVSELSKTEFIESRKFIDKARNEYVKKCLDGLTHQFKEKPNAALMRQLRNYLFFTGFEAVLTRTAAFVNESYHDKKPEWLHWPTRHEGEEMYRQYVDRLTSLLRKYANPEAHDRFMHSSRSLRKIGFTGRNRIVYAGEMGERGGLRRLYGEPPPEFIKTWEEREGKWKEI